MATQHRGLNKHRCVDFQTQHRFVQSQNRCSNLLFPIQTSLFHRTAGALMFLSCTWGFGASTLLQEGEATGGIGRRWQAQMHSTGSSGTSLPPRRALWCHCRAAACVQLPWPSDVCGSPAAFSQYGVPAKHELC